MAIISAKYKIWSILDPILLSELLADDKVLSAIRAQKILLTQIHFSVPLKKKMIERPKKICLSA